MIDTAEAPTEVKVAVCWQHGPDEIVSDFVDAGFEHLRSFDDGGHPLHKLTRHGAIVDLIDVHFLKTKGCGWARATAQRRYRNERYSLQIDAHHRFIDGWDSALIDMMESLRNRYPKPLLTGYPPNFQPQTYPESKHDFPFQMLARGFSEYGIVKFKPVPIPDAHLRTEPMRARFISGGFIFADGSFVKEIMNDEEHFFSTEEIAMAVRAFTHGYSFFHPHKVVLWHQYRSPARKVWDDHTPERKASGEIEATAMDRSAAGRDRFLELLRSAEATDETSLGEFGLGNQRTIRQYERFSGLSFRHRGLRREAMTATEPSEFDECAQEMEWEEGLVCTRVLRVKVAQNRLGAPGSDEVTVTAFDDRGIEIVQKRLPLTGFKASSDGLSVECFFAIEASPSNLPRKYELKFDHCNATEPAGQVTEVVF